LDVQNCAAVNIPLKQLQAFSTKPLAPIKLDSYVSYLTRSQIGLPPVSSSLPFDVSSERATQTHSSQATMNRVKTDVYKYAEQANTEMAPTLIGFTPAEIDSLHQNPAVLSKATAQLGKLIKALNQAMEYDRKSLWNLMNRSLAIATSDERSDTPSAGGPNGEINFLRFRLGQVGEREPAAWFELLVASILSTTSEHDIRSLNPHMSSVAYKTVTSLAVVAMLTSIRISQTHRALTRCVSCGVCNMEVLLSRLTYLFLLCTVCQSSSFFFGASKDRTSSKSSQEFVRKSSCSHRRLRLMSRMNGTS
jgi:hypothetical protein